MASPGHEPVTNTGPRNESARVLESAGPFDLPAAPATSVQSLPYYKRPSRPRRRMLESFTDEAADLPVVDEAQITDVATASFGPSTDRANSMIFEVVIGSDDRVQVSAARMATNPWRQICALRIVSQSNKMYVGTGWFISPSVLATAGHCVFLQDDGGWAKSIKVIAGKHGTREPFGVRTSQRFASVKGWVTQRKRDFDYGVIFLDDASIGTQLGNFAVEARNTTVLRGSDAQVSGYPADRDRAEFQYFHMRPMSDVTDTRLVYDIDTFGGQSGSPIWQETVEDGVVAVGIHTTGGVTSNSGTRITEDVLDNLIRWTE